jgi:hypothetical protein
MKHYKVIFSQRVINDIEEGVIYYNEQKHNLGNKFARQVESTLNAIRINPYHFPLDTVVSECESIPISGSL